MEVAKTLLQEIANALNLAINVKIKKGGEDPTLFDDLLESSE